MTMTSVIWQLRTENKEQALGNLVNLATIVTDVIRVISSNIPNIPRPHFTADFVLKMLNYLLCKSV